MNDREFLRQYGVEQQDIASDERLSYYQAVAEVLVSGRQEIVDYTGHKGAQRHVAEGLAWQLIGQRIVAEALQDNLAFDVRNEPANARPQQVDDVTGDRPTLYVPAITPSRLDSALHRPA